MSSSLFVESIPEGFDLNGYDSDEFYGLDIYDSPVDPIDDEIQYLHENDRRSIANEVTDEWTSRLISDPGEPIEFHLDSSRKEAWSKFQDEIAHLRSSVPILLKEMDPNYDPSNCSPTLHDLYELAFGKKSEVSTLLCKELGISRQTFVKFMGNLCLQMAYKESPSCLYDEDSQLKKATLMDEQEYMKLWKIIATKKRVSLRAFVGTSRRNECLWEMMERVVNKILRDLSIAGRTDDITIALDDDKIWVELSGSNELDTFGLRKVTHVKDNRKGIVAHTAVSTTANIPLCFIFERVGDTAVKCFLRIFGKLFPVGGSSDLPDLVGIRNHSDRAYTIRETLFDFFLPAGANFNNTAKRINPFPFIWGMKPSANDQRKVLDEKGAPTLFVKDLVKHNRLVTCAAFRTGTNNISAIVSSVVHGHQWEGFCLNQKQRIAYEVDPFHGLDKLLFQKLAGVDELIDKYKDEMDTILIDLKEEKINVLTLEQGTADWHKGRQFSLTSSQSDASFRKAFIIHQQDDDWCIIAEYMNGETYHEGKSVSISFFHNFQQCNFNI